MKSLFQIVMNKLLIILLLICIPVLLVQAQDSRIRLNSLDHLAVKANESVDINLDERLMRITSTIFSDKDAEEREIKKLIAGLKGIYVRNFEFDNSGQYTDADVESIRSQVRGPGWTRLVNVRSKKEGGLEVYLLMNGEEVGGLVVLALDEKELTVVNIVGPVNIDKLAKLEGHFGIPDLELESPKPKTKNDDQ